MCEEVLSKGLLVNTTFHEEEMMYGEFALSIKMRNTFSKTEKLMLL